MEALAATFSTVYASRDPGRLYLGSPSILAMQSGRLVASHDFFGPGTVDLPGPKGLRPHKGQTVQARVYTSDDGGEVWVPRCRFPFFHARLFLAGGRLYLLGHCGRIMISRSDDGGDTWTAPSAITEKDSYTQTAANVWLEGDHVYLVMMRICDPSYEGYFISELAAVLLRAAADVDLTVSGSWAFSEPIVPFRELAPERDLDFHGIPFFPTGVRRALSRTEGDRQVQVPNVGWHEAHVVRISDKDHYWFDPTGRTFHIIARCETHLSNYAAIARVVEDEQGSMRLSSVRSPSGRRWVFLPVPGGQMRFHILFDEISRLFWLVSTQTTDSMTRIGALPADRYGLPYNERSRLQLCFSRNLVDWCFAGLVAAGGSALESRHYCSATIDGEDLLILSRSGDVERNPNAHDTNLITLHRVQRFRGLVY